jgi:hypothetical protein
METPFENAIRKIEDFFIMHILTIKKGKTRIKLFYLFYWVVSQNVS